jgi:hypothetical protein
VEQDLRARIAAMSDESLLAIIENKSSEYTPDALALVIAEISSRGGIEFLKQKVVQSPPFSTDDRVQEESPPEKSDPSDEIQARLKRFYWLFVLVAYGLFMYVVDGSLWVYWLCVFVMIGFWVRVMIRARTRTPEEEYSEIAREMEKQQANEVGDSLPSNPNDRHLNGG